MKGRGGGEIGGSLRERCLGSGKRERSSRVKGREGGEIGGNVRERGLGSVRGV